MCFNFCGVKFKVHFLFLAVVTLLLFIDRSGMFLYAFLSSAAHELAHLAVLFAVHGTVVSVTFEMFGIRIEQVDSLLFYEEMIMLMAGPSANLLIFILCMVSEHKAITLIGAINLSIALFNLLPVGPLDGGKALRLILSRLMGEKKGYTASLILSLFVLLVLFLIGIKFLLSPQRNFSMLLVCMFMASSLAIEFVTRHRAEHMSQVGYRLFCYALNNKYSRYLNKKGLLPLDAATIIFLNLVLLSFIIGETGKKGHVIKI